MKSPSLQELKSLNIAQQRNKIFNVFGDGKKIGITIASNEATALKSAFSGFTRKTTSKEDFPDYENIRVELMSMS